MQIIQSGEAAGAAIPADGDRFDLIVVGGGAAGLTAAIFAARRGGRVLLVDHADELGGSLLVSTGQMSAAGTRLQRALGIEDHPDHHFEDVMRISRGTANPDLVRLAVDNAAATFDWLMEEGFQPLPDHPVTGYGHEPYGRPRYYWGEDGGLSVRNVLVPIVEALERSGSIQVRLRHEAVALETAENGRVAGVRLKGPDCCEHSVLADAVLLACGGYAGNAEMFEQLNGFPQYNGLPYPGSRGAGLKLGESVGGYARGEDNLFINFGTLFDTDSRPAKPIGRIEHFPERRMPWEIYVNAAGDRFVREDLPSVDAREMALFLQPDYRYWIVFDDRILEEAPPIVVGWDRERLRAAFSAGSPTFLTASTIEELASLSGMDPVRLSATLHAYEYGVRTGNDFFGRRHLPLPVCVPPFRAIRMQGTAISSAIGLAVDHGLRVIRRDGTPIGGLYAAGEVLGSGQTMGKSACGGMMVTPALTFGRLLGQEMIALGSGR